MASRKLLTSEQSMLPLFVGCMQSVLWVELVGNVIVARVKGALTEEVIKERHARILQMAKDTGCKNVLFDTLEADAPTVTAIDAQRSLNPKLKTFNLRGAVVVPNIRMAYLARLVFEDVEHRVFYNHFAQAMLWLATT